MFGWCFSIPKTYTDSSNLSTPCLCSNSRSFLRRRASAHDGVCVLPVNVCQVPPPSRLTSGLTENATTRTRACPKKEAAIASVNRTLIPLRGAVSSYLFDEVGALRERVRGSVVTQCERDRTHRPICTRSAPKSREIRPPDKACNTRRMLESSQGFAILRG
jgi:hypothetical protein